MRRKTSVKNSDIKDFDEYIKKFYQLNKRKNFLIIQKTVFKLVFEKKLTQSDLVVYCFLVYCSDKNGECYPSIEKISKNCFDLCQKRAKEKTSNSIKNLINSGAVLKSSQKSKDFKFSTNRYKINFDF